MSLSANVAEKADAIPFTRYFYRYEAPKPAEEIKAEILAIEKDLDNALHEIFG